MKYYTSLKLKDGMVLKIIPFNNSNYFKEIRYLYNNTSRKLYIDDLLKYRINKLHGINYASYNKIYSLVEYNNELHIVILPLSIINKIKDHIKGNISLAKKMITLNIKSKIVNINHKLSLPDYKDTTVQIDDIDYKYNLSDVHNNQEYYTLMNKFKNSKIEFVSNNILIIKDLIKSKLILEKDVKHIFRKEKILNIKNKMNING